MLKNARSVVLAICMILSSGPVTIALAGEIDQSAKTYLEGVWLLGKRPDQGACVSTDYGGAIQWGFEFEKTGGRWVQYEPYDLFTAAKVDRIEKSGDELTVWLRAPKGNTTLLGRFRLLPPDRFESVPAKANEGEQSPDAKPGDAAIANRCGTLNRSVTGDIPIERLALLTPISGGFWMYEVQPGVPDADVCRGGLSKRWIQMEALGPAHFYVIGLGFLPEYRFDMDYIRKVDIVDETTLRLTLQDPGRDGTGWDRKGGYIYELTVIDRNGRFEIPELSATFIRCDQLIR